MDLKTNPSSIEFKILNWKWKSYLFKSKILNKADQRSVFGIIHYHTYMTSSTNLQRKLIYQGILLTVSNIIISTHIFFTLSMLKIYLENLSVSPMSILWLMDQAWVHGKPIQILQVLLYFYSLLLYVFSFFKVSPNKLTTSSIIFFKKNWQRIK